MWDSELTICFDEDHKAKALSYPIVKLCNLVPVFACQLKRAGGIHGVQLGLRVRIRGAL